MAQDAIKTEGFKELDKQLQQLPITMEKKILNKALLGAMRTVVKDVKAAAPVHKGAPSENSEKYKSLKKNIKVKRGGNRKRWVKEAVLSTGNAFWALFYELGTVKQAPRPFFLPTFYAGQAKIINEFKARLKKGIEDEVKKAKK